MKKISIFSGSVLWIVVLLFLSSIVASVISGSKEDNAIFQLQDWSSMSIFEYNKISLSDIEKDWNRTIKVVYWPISPDVVPLVEKKLIGASYKKTTSQENIIHYEINSDSETASSVFVLIDNNKSTLTIEGVGKVVRKF